MTSEWGGQHPELTKLCQILGDLEMGEGGVPHNPAFAMFTKFTERCREYAIHSLSKSAMNSDCKQPFGGRFPKKLGFEADENTRFPREV